MPLFMQSLTALKTPAFPRINVSSFSSTSHMPSTLSIALPYFAKLGYTPLPSQLGWNAAMVPNQFSILSSRGVQQGDPLGPLGFALALQPIVHRIEREVPGLLVNTWYLDDGTLCGSLEDLAAALSIIESEGPPRGLLLNRSKSLIASPANSSVDHPLPSAFTCWIASSGCASDTGWGCRCLRTVLGALFVTP